MGNEMSTSQRTNQSSRVALAGLLHDLGKFTERARIGEAMTQQADGNRRRDIDVQFYCPHFQGKPTHIHAAYTAMGVDLLASHLPDIVGGDMSPFAPWKERNADDSLINAAARHHRPDTYLQWLIATADRLASGFERQKFDAYNAAPDEHRGVKLNHYTTRQATLLERIRLSGQPIPDQYRYPLKPLSPESIFPMPSRECETDNNGAAQAKYLELWNGFKKGLVDIPESHRACLPLWLDHFDSLWLTFTHAIPSATAGGVRPDVSLYDHSKTTAALAVALWRYHADLNHDPGMVRDGLRAQWDRERSNSPTATQAWSEEKFLLIQGDFFGIQHFIFAEGSQTQKRAAKLLRGRSFYVSLLTELAALKVLEALDLPSISQVVNAAGKFLIVAPHTPEAIRQLESVQRELDTWFLEQTYGQSGVGLAWLPAKASDFHLGAASTSPFRDLMKRLFQQLESAKMRRFGLCGGTPASAVFGGFLDRFKQGECKIDGRSPGTVELERGLWVSDLAHDQVMTGQHLASCKRLLVTRERLDRQSLRLPIFGYWVSFIDRENAIGNFGHQAKTGNLLRAWDFSWPESGSAPLWNGYARRHINAYIPRFGDLNGYDRDRYRGLDLPEQAGEIKTLNHLARDDRQLDNRDRWIGQEALMTLKGDVDNLGLIFQAGLENPTFAKMAALSRQMNAFFAVYLPWLCQSEARFRNTYTVFAGGDDFFLIGPWLSTIHLAQRMKEDFRRYVAENPFIHFSAGLSMTKPGAPIRQLATLADEALDQAKSFAPNENQSPPKNAVTCFGRTVAWADFDHLLERETGLARIAEDYALSTGYLYGLLRFTEMAGRVEQRPENAIWHSQFAYRTRRLAETYCKHIENPGQREAARRDLQASLAREIVSEGIVRHGDAYKIALFTYLYQQRD